MKSTRVPSLDFVYANRINHGKHRDERSAISVWKSIYPRGGEQETAEIIQRLSVWEEKLGTSFFFSSFHFLFLVFLRSTCRSRELENGTPPRVRDLRGWWRTRSFKGLADDVKRAERGSALSSRFRGSKRASFFFFFFFVLPFPAKHDQSLFPPFQQFVNDDDSPLVPRP